MASLKRLIMLCRCCFGATATAQLLEGAYQGKVIWIRVASSSLSKELSMQLGCMGAKLILMARTVDALEHVTEYINAPGIITA
jgi:NADP-dependent 3-hydroxy acid dehydrogenase YdfG